MPLTRSRRVSAAIPLRPVRQPGGAGPALGQGAGTRPARFAMPIHRGAGRREARATGPGSRRRSPGLSPSRTGICSAGRPQRYAVLILPGKRQLPGTWRRPGLRGGDS
jgi:hypothetical protein